jgi:hypothetical protein
MTVVPLAVDVEKLRRVVDTAAACITQGIDDYFQLRLVSRADYRDDDPLMVELAAGATERCFAVELIDARKGDDMAVKVQGIRSARAYTRRCAGMLWRAWIKGGGPEDGVPPTANA